MANLQALVLDLKFVPEVWLVTRRQRAAPSLGPRQNSHDGLELVGKLALFALVGVRGVAGLLLAAELQRSRRFLLELVLFLGKFSNVSAEKEGINLENVAGRLGIVKAIP